jgi:hypothetical protein
VLSLSATLCSTAAARLLAAEWKVEMAEREEARMRGAKLKRPVVGVVVGVLAVAVPAIAFAARGATNNTTFEYSSGCGATCRTPPCRLMSASPTSSPT